ncbi:hypothetical protein Unana1_06181 [Umbelopsis nana]
MSTQPDKTEVNEALKPIESPPNEENKTALSRRKEEEVTGMEVGTFDSNCSDDILPGGRIPGSNDDTRFVTTRKELWAYYSYYVGNNGQVRDINSIVLLCNGISFALQAGMFLLIGSFADYGTWRPWINITFTVIAWGVSFGWLGVETPDKWQIAAALYIIGLIAYQGALTFWTAAFPQLARDLPEMIESEQQVLSGEKSMEEHEILDVMSRNRISNMSFVVCNAGEVIILAIMVGILKAVNSDGGVEQNTMAFSILIAFSAAAWIVCAIPWFVLEKRRPGKDLPPGTNYITIAIKNLWFALKECLKLKQTCEQTVVDILSWLPFAEQLILAVLYLIFYFLMGDVLNTSVTVLSTIQKRIMDFLFARE